MQRRVAVGRLEHLQDPRAQPRRVVERVERERVLLRAGGAEEVRLRAGGQHERVAREALAVGERDRARRRVERGHLAELDVDVLVVAEQLAQRERDVARRELRGRHLVEQRLELVVVVAVDQRDAHAVLAREPLDAADAGEAAADDDHVPLLAAVVTRHARAPAPRARAPMRSSRWSPTRSALAIAVSAGFTAPMLGKKLVSTT